MISAAKVDGAYYIEVSIFLNSASLYYGFVTL